MAIIRPFRAIRPVAEKAEKVAALPYDVMNSEEAREMVKDNPYSFLHIDKAEIDLDPFIDLYHEKVYQKAKQNMEINGQALHLESIFRLLHRLMKCLKKRQ